MEVVYRNDRSWRADAIARDMANPISNIYELIAVEAEKPCALCGRVVQMRRKQRYCTACSMIPPYKRKQMLEGKTVC